MLVIFSALLYSCKDDEDESPGNETNGAGTNGDETENGDESENESVYFLSLPCLRGGFL